MGRKQVCSVSLLPFNIVLEVIDGVARQKIKNKRRRGGGGGGRVEEGEKEVKYRLEGKKQDKEINHLYVHMMSDCLCRKISNNLFKSF